MARGPNLTQEIREKIFNMKEAGFSPSFIRNELSISINTYYSVLRKHYTGIDRLSTDRRISFLLNEEAKRRGMSAFRLKKALMFHIVEGDLFKAILDDE